MAWSASKIMMSFLEDVFENTSAIDLNSDSFKITLWDNDITPDQTAASRTPTAWASRWKTPRSSASRTSTPPVNAA